MHAEMGNDRALEGYRDGENVLQFRILDGQRVTRVEFPPETGLQEAFSIVVDGVVPAHFQADAKPVWVETDSEALKLLLEEKYGIKGSSRPTGWGE